MLPSFAVLPLPTRLDFGWSRADDCENHDSSIPAKDRERSQVEQVTDRRRFLGGAAVIVGCRVFKQRATLLGHITQVVRNPDPLGLAGGWLPITTRCLT